jgi:heme oxygenase
MNIAKSGQHVIPTRAEGLRAATQSTHETLDKSIMASNPFASMANYTRFLKVQHALHRDVLPLYLSPVLQHLIPDLSRRSRFAAVTQDAARLGAELPDYTDAPAVGADFGVPEALGWLYVVEGSNLGAAFLYKAAVKMGLSVEHGASHLAEAPEGRAASWRAFKDRLNAAKLSPAEEVRVIAGAEAAFARVRMLVAQHLS